MRFFRELMIAKARADGYPAGCIHRSKNYGRTNDDADRDRLIDLSGTGTDIILYNVGYALNSGFGSWAFDLNKFKSYSNTEVTRINYSTFNIKGFNNTYRGLYIGIPSTSINFFVKVKFNIKVSQSEIFVYYFNKEGKGVDIANLQEGINKINTNIESELIGERLYFLWRDDFKDVDFDLEFLPDYKGALVSDGVDDYGLCENFPILTKDRGYTVCAIRKILDTTAGIVTATVSTAEGFFSGAFIFEYKNNVFGGYNFGSFNNYNDVINTNTSFAFQNSKKYNNKELSIIGDVNSTSELCLFKPYKSRATCAKIALYALEIYDHDLTDEEIQAVKARMIREYEEGTGLPYDETGALIADYEAYDKSNDSPTRDVLEDRSGNSRDIKLYNFGYEGGSGYGLYAQNFNNWQPNSDAVKISAKTYNKIRFDFQSVSNPYLSYIFGNYYNNALSYKIKCESNINDVRIRFLKIDSSDYLDIPLNANGITEISVNDKILDYNCFLYCESKQDGFIELEQIPEYAGALVSDGVDDKGVCENFPILTKEKGYTVLAIRKILAYKENLNDITALISNGNSITDNAFIFEYQNGRYRGCYSFGNFNNMTSFKEGFSYQTSNMYNGVPINKGETLGSNKLSLFIPYPTSSGYCSAALYALKIFNRDLTDDEIAVEKAKMIKRYEEKTGNKYVES